MLGLPADMDDYYYYYFIIIIIKMANGRSL